MAAPVYKDTGTYSVALGNAPLTPAYPSTIAAGDMLVIQAAHQNNSNQSPVPYVFPANFTLLFSDQQSDTRLFIYNCIATGTETGTISITATGSTTATHRACIHQFGNAPGPVEGGALGSAAPGSVLVTDTAVTTAGVDRLAINMVTCSASNTPDTLGGATGGTWALSSGSTAGLSNLWLETATMSTAGTIDGGSTAIVSTSWINRGFALIGNTALPRNIVAANKWGARFDALAGSTAPSFSSSAIGNTAALYALEASPRIWQGPSNRAVRLANSVTNQAYYVKFGSSLTVAASSDSMLVLGGRPSIFSVPANATHISVVSSTTTTVNVTLGTVR